MTPKFAASSHRLVAQSGHALRASASDEETRAYLQERITLFAKLMFWSFLALMLFLAGAYVRYPDLAPEHNVVIFGTGATGLAVMGGIWQGVLRRRPLSMKGLWR